MKEVTEAPTQAPTPAPTAAPTAAATPEPTPAPEICQKERAKFAGNGIMWSLNSLKTANSCPSSAMTRCATVSRAHPELSTTTAIRFLWKRTDSTVQVSVCYFNYTKNILITSIGMHCEMYSTDEKYNSNKRSTSIATCIDDYSQKHDSLLFISFYIFNS